MAKKYVLDFNRPCQNMAGNDIGHLGEMVASALETRQEGDEDKFTDWAESLYAHKPIEIDRADRIAFGEWVEKATFWRVVKRRMKEVLKESPVE